MHGVIIRVKNILSSFEEPKVHQNNHLFDSISQAESLCVADLIHISFLVTRYQLCLYFSICCCMHRYGAECSWVKGLKEI